MAPVAPVFSTIYSSFPLKEMKWKHTNSQKAVIPPDSSQLLWLDDSTLSSAINELAHLEFDPKDVKYLNNIAVILPFKSGKEAFEFIKKSNIRIF